MNIVAGAAKALLGAVIAFVGALGTALVGDQELSDLSDGQWVTAALAALVVLGGVWAIPNKES